MDQFFGNNIQYTHFDSPVKYSDDVGSESYIDQFLSISDLSSQKHQHQEIRYSSLEQMLPKKTLKPSQIDSVPKQKSAYHNFQKHLVTTLRNNIFITSETFPIQTRGIQKKLWKCFLENKKPTRTLILLITGSIQNQNLMQEQQTRKLYGINRLYKSFSSQLIKQAQINLKNQILEQFSKMDIDNILNNRRMKKKQQFKAYLQTFKTELREGKINRRLPKQKRKCQIKKQQYEMEQQE